MSWRNPNAPKKIFHIIRIPCEHKNTDPYRHIDPCGCTFESIRKTPCNHTTLDYDMKTMVKGRIERLEHPKGGCWTCKGKGYTTQKEQVFLCIGGPQDGKMRSASQLGKQVERYAQYNIGGYYRGGKKLAPAVYIHDSITVRS